MADDVDQFIHYKENYTLLQRKLIAKEFERLQGQCYIDHAGATLYSETQISEVFSELSRNVYANPHANNTSSQLTEDLIDYIRHRVLEHFSTTSEEYSVIFTSGATAGLKIIAESFDYKDGDFVYLNDNHTSVLGMRAFAKKVTALKSKDAFKVLSKKYLNDSAFLNATNSLFVYPAESNYSGTKYPLSWIKSVHENTLNNMSNLKSKNWFVALDAACFVSTCPLDLSKQKPDFVTISFYKIFGYPTGLGALIVRNQSAHLLKKIYYGGGTVLMALSMENIAIPRPDLHENFEDGTIPFLSIAALKNGFETFERLKLSMELISQHTFELGRYVYRSLLTLYHSNGYPVAKLYHNTDYSDILLQGGIVNFNFLRSNGEYIGFSEVLHVANLFGIHLRTGCCCNPGACQMHLQLSNEDVKHHFSQGHVCGDQRDLVDGYPTGSVRISFGYMSTKEDADKFLKMVEDYFVSKPILRMMPSSCSVEKNHNHISKSLHLKLESADSIFNDKSNGILHQIFIYPIKSCGAFKIEKSWKLISTGLDYDRKWMIVNSNGICITQKHRTQLCLIKPMIDLDNDLLHLHFEGYPSINISLSEDVHGNEKNASFCKSKICGDKIEGLDCGDDVARWLSDVLDFPGLRLLRHCSNINKIGRISRKGEEIDLSLANKCQYLLINVASVQWLLDCISEEEFNETLDGMIMRFRPNLVVNFSEAFIENNLDHLEINSNKFNCVGECTRCHMVCINQLTAQKSAEPLRTLSSQLAGGIRFGIYLKQSEILDIKEINVGDFVMGEKKILNLLHDVK